MNVEIRNIKRGGLRPWGKLVCVAFLMLLLFVFDLVSIASHYVPIFKIMSYQQIWLCSGFAFQFALLVLYIMNHKLNQLNLNLFF